MASRSASQSRKSRRPDGEGPTEDQMEQPTRRLRKREKRQARQDDGDPAGEQASEGGTPVSGDAAVGSAISKGAGAAAGAASGMGKSIMGGYRALRQVREANKQLATAQAEQKKIMAGLDEDRAMLAHREDITRNYAQIMATQTTERDTAQSAADDAGKRAEKIAAERDQIVQDLTRLKADNENKLRPYRNLMESSKGRADDTAKSLANSRRALKACEGEVSAATKRREQRIQAANQAVDNAQERLRRVQAELADMKADSEAAPGAVAKMQTEVQAEEAHLETARQDVTRITREAQADVDSAQQHLWERQKLTDEAERLASSAKTEANSHKSEFDRMFKAAQSSEKNLDDAIKAREATLKEIAKQREAAEKRVREATEAITEATEIHGHPETTAGLRERIANEEQDLADKQAEVSDLTKSVRGLKHSTRGMRAAFIATVIVVLVVVIALLWYFVMAPGAAGIQ